MLKVVVPVCKTDGPISTSKLFKNIEFYRKLIQVYIDRQDFATALYWADKVVTFSNGAQQDVYAQAQCMCFCDQYYRAASIIQTHNYERSNLYFRCLTARCLFMAKEYSKALDVLDLENNSIKPGQKIRPSKWEPSDPQQSILGQLYLLKGKIYEALMNRALAAQNYKDALYHDVYCVEAFHLLTQHQMLSRAEEQAVFENIPFPKYCANGDIDLVKYLYSLKIKKYPSPSSQSGSSGSSSSSPYSQLKKNVDILSAEAEKYYYHCDFQGSYQLARQVFEEDPFHYGCLPVFIACLVELKKSSELFKLAHKLIEVMSETAIAWYAVGSYYFLIGKQEQARRNLNKALSIDSVFGPAWLLFGHSFATESEHDQAMAAYFKATQLMKGCHLPMLHVGLECGISNNPQLAMKFLHESEQLAPKDPYVRHEMGVVKFNEKKYAEALSIFMETLAFIKSPTTRVFMETWEPLYNNLGHACRKMKRYEEAYHYHRRALVLFPSNASTHSAIGLLHAITGKTELAIESFHKALSLRREDTFSNTMLRHVIEKMVEESNGDSNVGIFLSEEEHEGSEYPNPNPVMLRRSLRNKREPATAASFDEDVKHSNKSGPSAYVEWLQHSKRLLEKYKGVEVDSEDSDMKVDCSPEDESVLSDYDESLGFTPND